MSVRFPRTHKLLCLFFLPPLCYFFFFILCGFLTQRFKSDVFISLAVFTDSPSPPHPCSATAERLENMDRKEDIKLEFPF